MRAAQPFFQRVTGDGRCPVGWRVWVLIWVAPALFLAAALLLQGHEADRHQTMIATDGAVVRIHAREAETAFDRGEIHHAPVFRHTWTDGSETGANVRLRHAGRTFEVGSVHEIRHVPGVKTDVLLPGAVHFAAGWIIGAIGLVCALPAGFATRRLRRRQGGVA